MKIHHTLALLLTLLTTSCVASNFVTGSINSYQIHGLTDRVTLLETALLRDTPEGKAMLSGAGANIVVGLPEAVSRGESVVSLAPLTSLAASVLAAHGLDFKRAPPKPIADVLRSGKIDGATLSFERVPDGAYLFALVTRRRTGKTEIEIDPGQEALCGRSHRTRRHRHAGAVQQDEEEQHRRVALGQLTPPHPHDLEQDEQIWIIVNWKYDWGRPRHASDHSVAR